MTIDLQTLKCGECGSSVLKRTGMNEYTCEHCGSVTLVEDKVSDRLERVLDQVKNEAGRRLAAEEALRQKLMLRKAGIGVAIVLGAVLVFQVVGLLFFKSRGAPAEQGASQGRQPVVASLVDRTIPTDGVKLGEPRQVLVGSGSSAQPKLLVVARNETGRPLSRGSGNEMAQQSKKFQIEVLRSSMAFLRANTSGGAISSMVGATIGVVGSTSTSMSESRASISAISAARSFTISM